MYAAVVDAMDQAIGRVLDTLDAEGIADDTIVLFFSDNGGAAYATGGADNVPLRGGKGETFEGGIRVVSVMRWPGRIEAGSKVESIMSVMDVFPTLAAAAGIEPGNERKLDGRDMWPAIAEGKSHPRDDYLFFASETPIRGAFSLTAFDDEWKLVQDSPPGAALGRGHQLPLPHRRRSQRVQQPRRASIPTWWPTWPQRIHRWRHPLSGVRERAHTAGSAAGLARAEGLGRLCEPYPILGGGLCR